MAFHYYLGVTRTDAADFYLDQDFSWLQLRLGYVLQFDVARANKHGYFHDVNGGSFPRGFLCLSFAPDWLGLTPGIDPATT
jgi:hypothetical protein